MNCCTARKEGELLRPARSGFGRISHPYAKDAADSQKYTPNLLTLEHFLFLIISLNSARPTDPPLHPRIANRLAKREETAPKTSAAGISVEDSAERSRRQRLWRGTKSALHVECAQFQNASAFKRLDPTATCSQLLHTIRNGIRSQSQVAFRDISILFRLPPKLEFEPPKRIRTLRRRGIRIFGQVRAMNS